MIEENLINYGVLGIWTFTLIIEKYNWQKNLTSSIKELTKAIQKSL